MQIPERLGQNSHFLDLAPTLNEAPCYVVQPLAQAMFFKSAYIKKTFKKNSKINLQHKLDTEQTY